jgi:cellulose synthase/poly-beta-1,6-N-acetylglucosamine synthase-like glycosyltransferase
LKSKIKNPKWIFKPQTENESRLSSSIKNKKFNFFLDPGEGKSYALNLLFQEYASNNTEDIFILTDGDVYVSDNAVREIMEAFKDKQVGCVTGKPTSIDNRNSKYGYFSHLFFDGIDRVRKKLSAEKKFFECSGYLFAVRKSVILDFPLETSEDSIIPYLFWKKGYKIAYAEKAEVYVKNPSNWEDWVNQKVRNIKAHENLNKIAQDMPRTKSFFNEIKFGALFALTYPRSAKEFFWTIEAYFARLYIYYKAFLELKKKKKYGDGWRETEIKSTKPLD